MKLCEMCGNEIDRGAVCCPFCENRQRTEPPPKWRRGVRTINLEAGLPTVENGLSRLQREIACARTQGVALLRVIHGWGSSGSGGRLRDACRSFLAGELKAGRLKIVVAGDDYSGSALAGRGLLSRHPALRSRRRSDTQNPGITFVEL